LSYSSWRPCDHGRALALDGKIIVGINGGEAGIRGFLDAYDPKTGERLWRTWTIPGPGQPGHDTWGGEDSWKTGAGPTCVTGSYDPELNLLYWGTGNPGPDRNGDGSSTPPRPQASAVTKLAAMSIVSRHGDYNIHRKRRLAYSLLKIRAFDETPCYLRLMRVRGPDGWKPARRYQRNCSPAVVSPAAVPPG
jgi:hypothetical protein